MKQIPLTKGMVATVSNQWFKKLSKVKWYAQKCGLHYYAARRDRAGRLILMHRVIMGATARQVVDHRDLCGLNNLRRNLRLASHSQNHGNQKKYSGRFTSRFKGVCRSNANDYNPWIAYITVDSKRRYLGYHSTPEKAARAYNKAARHLFGPFALLNLV